jgi:hypothetical protein
MSKMEAQFSNGKEITGAGGRGYIGGNAHHVTPGLKAKTKCSLCVCPGSSCHTYDQNINTKTNVFII